MRTVGFAVLGMFTGVLLGFVLTDVIARITLSVGDGDIPLPIALFLGFAIPLCALVGVGVGVLVERSTRR